MEHTELGQLIGAYYHEDYDAYGGLWGSLDLYLSDSTADEVQRLRRDLEAALAMTDDEIDALLKSHHCAISMDREPRGNRGWLEEIARRVADA